MTKRHHKWNRTGRWNGSKGVRTCVACGLQMFKRGFRGPYACKHKGATAFINYIWVPSCDGDKVTA